MFYQKELSQLSTIEEQQAKIVFQGNIKKSKIQSLTQIQMPKTEGVTLGGFYGLKMCELIVTHGTLNWDQINNIGTHLTNKWGLVQWDELAGTLR